VKKQFLFILFCACYLIGAAQNAASIATDVSILRNLTPGHKFWAFGQTVQGNFHLSPKWTAYASINYYTNGKTSNELTATAKDPLVNNDFNFSSNSSLRYRQISLGFKRYIKGNYNNAEDGFNVYTITGLGLLFGRAENAYSQPVDTARYTVPLKAIDGENAFKRLTLDLGFGAETMMGAGIYFYTDARTWIPASSFPTPYLFNNNAPRTFSINAGIRILFD
jgi:hypothetical protein